MLLILLCITTAGSLKAQEFELIGLSSPLETSYQSAKSSYVILKNLSNVSKEFTITLDQHLLSGGSSAIMCYRGFCSISTINLSIDANSTSGKIEITLRGGLTDINSSMLLKVKDDHFKNDIQLDIPVTISGSIQSDIFFKKNSVTVSNFYPNPALAFATLHYSVTNADGQAKIVLQNVLGSKINEYKLDPRAHELKLDTEQLKPGVYFYTLLIDDEGLATRKLVIKK